MKRIFAFAIIAIVAGAGAAQARPERPNPDTNSDGYVSREEASAQARLHFQQMDINKDGKLDQADREGFREKMKAWREERKDGSERGPGQGRQGPPGRKGMGGGFSPEADLNADGAISSEEFVAQALRFFEARDADGDGRVKVERPGGPD